VTLGENEEAYGHAWHLPAAPAVTTREFFKLIFQAAGQPLKIQVMPKLVMQALGLVVPPLQNISELFYEFEEPFVVDHSKFDEAFNMPTTPINEAIKITLAWYKAN
jgi:nucleoside-diphosphate-sugar epimerase